MVSLTTIKIIGVASVASYAFARFAIAAGWLGWHRQHVVAVDRDKLPAMPRGYTIHELDAEALRSLEIDASPDVQADRFAQGFTCLGLFTARGALAGVVWLGTGKSREGTMAVDFVLPANACWDTGMWIHPDYRRGRAFAALWAGVGAWMDERGLSHSYSIIVDYNVPSLTSHRRLGMHNVATLLVLRIGRWQWIARGSDRWRLVERSQRLNWCLPDVIHLPA